MSIYCHAVAAVLFAVTLSASPLLRADAHGEDSGSADATIPEPLYFASEGSTRVGGRTIDYDVVAATMEMKDKEGEVLAHFGYTSYTRKGGPVNPADSFRLQRRSRLGLHVAAHGYSRPAARRR